jgi:transposase
MPGFAVYRHGINRKITLHRRCKIHCRCRAGAYWLLDEIAIIQPHEKVVAAEEFQVWTLKVRADRTPTLTC